MSPNANDIPYAPRACPVFYGWVILAAGIVGTLASVPGQTVGVSVFTDPLLEALHLDRTQLSTAYMVGTIGSALLMTRAGRLYDLYGGRTGGVIAGLSLGVVLLGLSRVDDVIGGVTQGLRLEDSTWPALVTMTLGFFLLRFTGQGVLTMVSRNMVMKWFEARRGFVNGLLSVCIGVGFSMAPRVFDSIIGQHGWDGAWMRLGLFLTFGFSLFALIVFRDNPEDCGLEPDGGMRAEQGGKETAPTFTLEEARRTWTFWVFNLATALMALYITALTFHVVSIFTVAGLSRDDAISIFIPASILSVFVSLGGGYLSDRIPLKYLLMAMLTGLVLSSMGILTLEAGWTRYLVIGGNGLAMGCFGLLIAMTWPTFFGRAHLGAISGFNLSWVVFFSAVGPVMFSLSRDHTGGYKLSTAVLAGAAVLLWVGGLRANAPAPPAPEGRAQR